MSRFPWLVLCLATLVTNSLPAADQPNIVWISCEDISPLLGCYGDPDATTPVLDTLAGRSVRYTRAFTCHGVCAPSRTGIITGMDPIGLGANHMRSKATLPEHVKCFPVYLRQAGYYCTNNSKTDYNFHVNLSDVWDESSATAHWRNRPDPDQPFFAVFNITVTHESRIWPANWSKAVKDLPPEQRHDPATVTIPPLYPDTPDVRAAHARLLDLITQMDRRVGRYLNEIRESGLAEDTIVMFWSDHGNGFPRGKRWVHDSGTRVPLLVHVPQKWRSPGQAAPGSVDDRLVNLIDLGPTALNLAGLKIPDFVFGRAFLGSDLPEPRQHIFGARDRIDERFDMVRSVRDDRFRYVRNYHAWRPRLPHIEYAETSVVRKEMRRLASAERSSRDPSGPTFSDLFSSPRPREELYDLQADPWEMRNVAGDPRHAATLQRLRAACDRWQTEVRDVHLIPEILLDEEEQECGSRWAILHRDPRGPERLKKLNALARVANQPAAGDIPGLVSAATAADAVVRWWAITGLANAARTSPPTAALTVFDSALRDESAAVRIAAARALHVVGQTGRAVSLLVRELDSDNPFVRHAALHELDEMGPAAAAALPAVRELAEVRGDLGKLARHAVAMWDE